LVSSILYANYHDMNKQGDVIGLNERMVNDIRKVQNNSIKRKGWEGQVPDGWGVKLDNTNDRYTIFADFDGDKELSTPVKLLIHGTEWSSGSTFTESSPSAKTVTKYGDATQVSNGGRPSNTNGYWSFDGTGDYLSLADSSDWNFGEDVFTIDAWIYITALSVYNTIVAQDNIGVTRAFAVPINNTDNKLRLFYSSDDGTSNSTFDCDVAFDGDDLNTWIHIAIVAYPDTQDVRMYLNGIEQSVSIALSAAYSVGDSSAELTVGGRHSSSVPAYGFNGYIDDLRIVKGAAMWKHNFTVPNKEHVSNIESVKVVNLSEGVKIASLVGESGAVDPLDVFFSPADYSTYQDGSVSNANVTIGLNDSSGVTAKTITINPYGLTSSD